jgi:hypothetical protein
MMILRRYGKNYVSVRPNFDSRAMTEIGFTRTSDLTVEAAGFEGRYELVENRILSPTHAGNVQSEVEAALLVDLENELVRLERGLGPDQILVLQNEQGVDHPKTRGKQGSDASGMDTRLTFEYTVDPPLRVGIYRST